MADFDVEAARKAGYSDTEIVDYLKPTTQHFDIDAARKAQYKDSEIIDFLGKQAPKPAASNTSVTTQQPAAFPAPKPVRTEARQAQGEISTLRGMEHADPNTGSVMDTYRPQGDTQAAPSAVAPVSKAGMQSLEAQPLPDLAQASTADTAVGRAAAVALPKSTARAARTLTGQNISAPNTEEAAAGATYHKDSGYEPPTAPFSESARTFPERWTYGASGDAAAAQRWLTQIDARAQRLEESVRTGLVRYDHPTAPGMGGLTHKMDDQELAAARVELAKLQAERTRLGDIAGGAYAAEAAATPQNEGTAAKIANIAGRSAPSMLAGVAVGMVNPVAGLTVGMGVGGAQQGASTHQEVITSGEAAQRATRDPARDLRDPGSPESVRKAAQRAVDTIADIEAKKAGGLLSLRAAGKMRERALSSYGRDLDMIGKGADAGYANVSAAIDAIAEGAGEAIGLGPFLRTMKLTGLAKAGFLPSLAEAMATNFGQEFATQAMQTLNARMRADPNITWNEALEQMTLAGMGGAAMGGAMHGPAYLAGRSRTSAQIAPDQGQPINGQPPVSPSGTPPEQGVAIKPNPAQTAPQPGTQGDLAAVVADKRPLAEIRGEQAANAQAKLQPHVDAAAAQQTAAVTEQQGVKDLSAELNGMPKVGEPARVSYPGGEIEQATVREIDDTGGYTVQMADGTQQYVEAGGDVKISAPPLGAGTPESPIVAESPQAIEQAGARVDQEPTDAQKLAGNYRKGHIDFQGLNVTIENPKGATRSGTGPEGAWSVEMPAHYGYVKRTEGADGDQVDVYIGDHPDSKNVYIVDQIDPATGKLDEHKVFLGYNSAVHAVRAYKAAFSDGSGAERMGAVSHMPMDGFKEWLRTGDTTKPVKYDEAGHLAKRKADLDSATQIAEELNKPKGAVNVPTEESRAGSSSAGQETQPVRQEGRPTGTQRQTQPIREESGTPVPGSTGTEQQAEPVRQEGSAAARPEPDGGRRNEPVQRPAGASETQAQGATAEGSRPAVPAEPVVDTSDERVGKLYSFRYKGKTHRGRIAGIIYGGAGARVMMGEEALSDKPGARAYFDMPLTRLKSIAFDFSDAGGMIPPEVQEPAPVPGPAAAGATGPGGNLAPRQPSFGDSNKTFTQARADRAREILRKKLGQVNTGLDPEIVQAGLELAGFYIEGGARTFAEFSTKMVGDLGEAVRPYLKSWYLAVRNYPGFDAGGMQSEAQIESIDAGNKPGVTSPSQNVNPQLQPGQPDRAGTPPLAGVPAGEVSGPEGERPAGELPQGGGTVDAGRNAGPSGGRNEPGRGVAAGEGASPAPAGGTEPGRGTDAGEPSVRRDGGNERGAEQPRGGLTPGEPVPVARNFVITDEIELGKGGQVTKFNGNVAAIQLLKLIESEGRQATPEEQKVLAQYVGWGGIKEAFPKPRARPAKGWDARVMLISKLLTPEEHEAAARSIQDAHYTSKAIVDGMWSLTRRLGFDGGRVLEDSMGVGNFFGLMPEDLRAGSRLTGIEQDSITARIAKQLYPQANVIHSGFQDVRLQDGTFNLSIGNPPFGSQRLYDKNSKHLNGFSLHNFFFAKAIDKLAHGGLHVQVVSRYFMDAQEPSTRQYIAQRAKLIGAIRLPWNAFYGNANTEVVTDIIILQKLPEAEYGKADTSWTETTTMPDPLGGEPMEVNRYFAEHPDMILGQLERSGTMYRENNLTVQPREGEPLEVGLAGAIATLPADIYQRGKTEAQVEIESEAAVAPGDVIEQYSVGSYFEDKGKLYQRVMSDDGSMSAVEVSPQSKWSEKQPWGDSRVARLRGMIQIREATRGLLKAERQDVTQAELDRQRKRLNKLYDAFVTEHGYLNEQANERTFAADPDAPLLLALEHEFDRGVSKSRAKTLSVPFRLPSAKKAPIFSQRVIPVHVPPTSADTPADGLTLSIREKGMVSIPYISGLTGKSESEVIEDLSKRESPLIFLDPAQEAYVLASDYLSGNVKKKYKEAMGAGLTDQAEKLRSVFPPDVKSGDIRARAGSPWVDRKAYEDFTRHLFGADTQSIVKYVPATGGFAVNIRGGVPAMLNTKWGTARRPGDDLLTRILNSKDLAVFDTDTDGTRHLNIEATQAANDKADEIKAEFEEWLFKDGERRERLVAHYNEHFNTDIDVKIDGSYLTLPGKVPDTVIELRRHQLNAVARAIRHGRILLDHVVGAGKTFTIIAAVMEMRRLGMLKKPMLVVPNHLVEQWATDFYRLYPGAKVLAMRKADFEKKNRQRMLARVATGDWDAVIFAHSSFGFIQNDHEVTVDAIREQIAEIQEAIDAAVETEGKKSRTSANYQKTKERLEQRIKALLDTPKDELLTFQELGTDMLWVDESQEFKNLFFTTQRRNVGSLGNPTGSKKAFDLFIKSGWLLRTQQGRGLGFATGTPISNSLTELYTLQRYLGRKDLEARGIKSLDAWLNAFGIVQSEYEPNVTGTKYKRKDRLRYITNAPEVLQLYRGFADSVSMDTIKENYRQDNNGAEFPIPSVKSAPKARENVVVDRTEEQAAFSEELQYRMENMPKDPREDNALAVLGDGRKGALDMRLIDPSLPDNPGSKVNEAADRITATWKANEQRRGTQLVFLDLSTPLKSGKAAAAKYLKEARELLGQPNAAPFGSLTQQWRLIRSMLQERASTVDENADTQGGSIEKIEKFLEDDADIQAAMTTVDTGFSVYDDLRQKLLDRGIPGGEIAFIHDFNGDTRKQELFDMVNAGTIRVLMGSTQKMGAGTNVQRKAVALHHLDVPWRPSDIEQREGRIVRQGNEFRQADPNFAVEIVAYATEGTSDVFMWQTQEQKLNGINSLRNFKGEREIAEVSADAMTAAEMKALASGNPLILEDVQLTDQVRKLEAQKRRHDANERDMDSELRRFERYMATMPQEIERLSKLVEKVRAYEADPFEGQAATAPIDGQVMTAQQAWAHVQEVSRGAKDAAHQENAGLREQIDMLQAEGKDLIDQSKFSEAAQLGERVKQLEAEARGKEKWSVTFNGKEYTSLDGIRTAIVRDLGDIEPIRMVIGDQAYVRRPDIGNALEPYIARLPGEPNKREKVGTIGGLDIEMAWIPAGAAHRGGMEIYIGGDHVFVDEFEGYQQSKGSSVKVTQPVTGSRLVGAIRNLLLHFDTALSRSKWNLEDAQKGMGPIKEQIGKPWGRDDELTTKRDRLATVRKTLAGTGETVDPEEKARVNAALKDRVSMRKAGKLRFQNAPRHPVRVTGRIKKLAADVGADADQLREKLKDLAAELDDRNHARFVEDYRPRVRGPEWFRERLTRAMRLKEITHDAGNLAIWLIDQNPTIAADVGLSIKQAQDGEIAAANYDTLNRIVTLFKGRVHDTEAVHELLHSTERLMPGRVQIGLRAAWVDALTRLLDGAIATKNHDLENWIGTAIQAAAGDEAALKSITGAIDEGKLPYDFYQYVNPSEFWAVNASRIFADRAMSATGWVGRARRWLSELIEKVKDLFGLQSDAPIIAGLNHVLHARDATARSGSLTQGLAEAFMESDEAELQDAPRRPPSQHPFDDPDTERRWLFSREGLGATPMLERLKQKLIDIGHGFTRHFKNLPNTAQFAKAYEALRQYQAAPEAAKEKVVRMLTKVTQGLTPEEYDIFSRRVVMDDLKFEADEGRDLAFNFTPASLDHELLKSDADLTQKIRDRIAMRKQFVDDIAAQLVAHGILKPEQVQNPAYFRHQVLEYAMQWQRSQGSGSKLKKPKSGYAKHRGGSIEDFNANYLEAEFEYMHKALIDIAAVQAISKIGAEYDIKARLQAQAKQQNQAMPAGAQVTWKDLIPDGYAIWQPDPGNQFYLGHSIGEKAIDTLLDQMKTMPSVDPHAMQDVVDRIKNALIVGARKREFVLPTEVADTLKEMRPDIATGLFDHLFADPVRYWKQWILINPRRFVKYNLNNLSGDLDAVIAGNPKSLKKLPQAISELYGVMKGGDPSPQYTDAMERGVFNGGLTVQEIPEINVLKQFEHLIGKPSAGEYAGKALFTVWRGLKDYTQFRENWMRYAAYLDYLERLQAGQTMKTIGYGASSPKLVDAITDTKDRAAMLARELVGDYGAVSYFGQGIRAKVIPFYSWMEINAKRYVRLIDNAFSQGILEGARAGGAIGAGLGARMTVWLGVRMTLMYALVTLFNQLFHADDEKELSPQDQLHLHLNLGKDKDGKVRVIRFQGALSDFLEWFGFADAVAAALAMERGQGSWADIANAIWHAPVNKLVQGATPLITLPMQMATGKNLYPDVFKARTVRDKSREVARMFSLENEYDLMAGKPTRGYVKSWRDSLTAVTRVDPGETAYYRTKDMVRKYLEKTKGQEGGGEAPNSPKSRLLYEWRMAVRYGDTAATDRAYAKLRELKANIPASIKGQHPLNGLSTKDPDDGGPNERQRFRKTLQPSDAADVDKAIDWYRKLYTNEKERVQAKPPAPQQEGARP